MTLDFRNLDPSVLGSSPSPGPMPNDHFVEFYDDDRSLLGSLQRFVSIGLEQGDAVIVVADASHRQMLEDEMGRTTDLSNARDEGRYRSVDAAETMALFLEDGVVDPARFESVIGGLIAEAGTGGRPVRVFGEMVALLWKQGLVGAALGLEDHWNHLADTHAFRLFCAYPTAYFGDKNLTPLIAVCDRHSHVLVSKAPTA
jgi:hypothetical protein